MKASSPHRWLSLMASTSALFLSAIGAHGAILAYEPFNYTQGTALGGQSGGTGFTGGWRFDNAANAGITWNIGAGLTMAGVASSGGAAVGDIKSTVASPTDAKGYAYRSFTSAIPTTTTFGSYLFQINTSNNNANLMSGVGLGGPTDVDNFASFYYAGDAWGSTGSGARIDANNKAPNGTNPITVGTTYIYLFQQDAGAKNLQAWVLTAAQYANFSGSLTAANLNSATQGMGAANVMYKTNYSMASTTIDPMTDLSIAVYTPGGLDYNVTIDEFRISNTSLAEAATAVPEPTVSLLAGLASLGFLARRRRNIA